MRARQENLRAARLAADIVDIGAHALIHLQVLARQSVIAADNRLGAAQVDNHIAVFHALDDAVDDLADAILVFLELALALGFAQALHHHLLAGLRHDPAEIEHRQVFLEISADIGGLVAFLGVGQRDLGRFVLHLAVLDHRDAVFQGNIAGDRVDLGADVQLRPVTRTGGLLDRFLDRFEDQPLIDRFFRRDRLGDLQQLQPVGADA